MAGHARNEHVVIVGAGFSGLAMAIQLKKAGIDDFTLLERASRVGGTWRDNTYPGAACDIESHLYSFSFDPNPGWTRTYASQPEILAYLESCVDRWQLRSHLRLDTGVTEAHFDEARGTWTLQTSRGGPIEARVVVAGTGGLTVPNIPAIEGLARFTGPTLHTARWDHSVAWTGRRVGVIGTGASAIQVVPALAPEAAQLTVFQRTPAWILPKEDHAVGPLARSAFANVPLTQRLVRWGQYARHELQGIAFVHRPGLLARASKEAVDHLARSVPDARLRRKLTPDYVMGCKRILLSNDFYPALCRPNVTLETTAIREVVSDGIVTTDGRHHPLDLLVLATGFQAADATAPFPVTGRPGHDLAEAWRDGPHAFLGSTVSGFPNMFLLVGPNMGLGSNSMVFMIEAQVSYVVDAIRQLRRRRWRFIDVKAGDEQAFNDELQRRMAGTVWSSGCRSWYRARSGRITTLWPGLTTEFFRRTRRFDPAPYECVDEARG